MGVLCVKVSAQFSMNFFYLFGFVMGTASLHITLPVCMCGCV